MHLNIGINMFLLKVILIHLHGDCAEDLVPPPHGGLPFYLTSQQSLQAISSQLFFFSRTNCEGKKGQQRRALSNSANRRWLKVIRSYWAAAQNRTDFSPGNSPASLNQCQSSGIGSHTATEGMHWTEMFPGTKMSFSLAGTWVTFGGQITDEVWGIFL